jgi:ABC-type polysaccharide/polyol phosphate export permease
LAAGMAVTRRFKNDLREFWSYRHLLRMLVVRDLKARYKNSALGIAWSFLQPLGMTAVMAFAFSIISRGGSDIPRYTVFILSGLLAWNFFSASVIGGTGSIVVNAALVKKVYFPRLILPISAVISSLINFLFALPMFVAVAVIWQHPLHTTLLYLPLVILIQVLFSVGISFMLATLNVFYRDTQFIVELGMQALFFLTPIWYDLSRASMLKVGGLLISPSLWLRRINPMASLVNIYQDLMYWGTLTAGDFWLRTGLTAMVVLVAGYVVFARYSAYFGEEV